MGKLFLTVAYWRMWITTYLTIGRSEVIEYIEKKYEGKTSKILTLNTLSGKLCMKECGKIVGELSETRCESH
jgi:hypothetical protein